MSFMVMAAVMTRKEQIENVPFCGKNTWENTYSTEVHYITPSQPLLPAQTLTSPGQIFELGFFSPNNPSNRYVGIWYKNITPHTVLWVANREKPVADSSASIKIDFDGNLNIMNGQNNSYWSTNISSPSNGSFAVLSDDGNAVCGLRQQVGLEIARFLSKLTMIHNLGVFVLDLHHRYHHKFSFGMGKNLIGEVDNGINRSMLELQGLCHSQNEEWSKGNWTRGCKRRVKLLCRSITSILRAPKGKANGFWKVSGIKLPDFSDNLKTEDANVCRQWCINNCSCNAYAFASGIDSVVWAGDSRRRLAEEKLLKAFIISLSAILIATILGLMAFGLCKRRTNQRVKRKGENPICMANTIDTSKKISLQHIKRSSLKEQESLELPILAFESILVATDNFNIANKLGQGGFGSIYKGTLKDGKDVAIKRLSSSSGQGIEEF
ncbi:conserved hypothetical protein [Ricinus communis]|uniref:Uncharacterized protein n=1 Tax=Ricinus communis TaxID=3988 RepID=B9SFF3_RICCO|nr:conserved hypothetical protein [Ricinus communis]